MKGLNISIRMKLSDPTQPDNLFLNMHGYDELPQGFEVHYIVPLSEGEADTPNNMIFLKLIVIILQQCNPHIISGRAIYKLGHRGYIDLLWAPVCRIR